VPLPGETGPCGSATQSSCLLRSDGVTQEIEQKLWLIATTIAAPHATWFSRSASSQGDQLALLLACWTSA
jgi:hypothetical protein